MKSAKFLGRVYLGVWLVAESPLGELYYHNKAWIVVTFTEDCAEIGTYLFNSFKEASDKYKTHTKCPGLWREVV